VAKLSLHIEKKSKEHQPMKKVSTLFLAILALGLLAACTTTDPDAGAANVPEEAVVTIEEPAAGEPPMDEEASMAQEEEMMSGDDDSMAGDEMAGDEMAGDEMVHEDMGSEEMAPEEKEDQALSSMEPEEGMIDLATLPAWQGISLTNARTGEPFTLADFLGKTVFVEPMATWCTNCRNQLHNVREARAQAGDDTVFVALSLETNISDAMLAQYADDAGFDWLFAVMTPEMLQELADAFGRSVTAAPSTPHFIVRADGSHTDLVTGIQPAAQILQQLQANQG
jgi:cytochrome oxidase Cu insertion factor (SCO1/SenC/PrrC family)